MGDLGADPVRRTHTIGQIALEGATLDKFGLKLRHRVGVALGEALNPGEQAGALLRGRGRSDRGLRRNIGRLRPAALDRRLGAQHTGGTQRRRGRKPGIVVVIFVHVVVGRPRFAALGLTLPQRLRAAQSAGGANGSTDRGAARAMAQQREECGVRKHHTGNEKPAKPDHFRQGNPKRKGADHHHACAEDQRQHLDPEGRING